MARKAKNTDADSGGDEIAVAQTNTAEQANAPKESTAQQAAEQIIAEGDSKQGNSNPVPAAEAAARVLEQQPPKPVEPAVSSTQAAGGLRTASDGPTGPTPQSAKDDPPRAERPQTAAEKADATKANADAEAAKAAGAEMIKLVVDGVEVEVPKGTSVIEAAFRAGSDIPYFCYHPRLTSIGACRMCLASVELEMFGQRRASIMTTCTCPAAEGMVVKTQTPDVKKAQNGILEFLLANHPLDCPICDRGGECPLQNMTIAYGPPTSRFIEEKRHYPKAMPISDYVVLDRERCIQCMRCTRFCEEISGDGQLSLHSRGAATEIGTFFGHDFSSNFSGNTIEICPVGALTSRTYRFAGRPWEIKSTDSVCSKCGNGCNIAVQTRMGDLVRVNGRTNEDVNEEWTCDRGKFGQYYVNQKERLKTPLIRRDGKLEEATWDEALRLVARNLEGFKADFGPDSIAGIASTRCTLEDDYLFAKMLRTLVGTNNVDHQMTPHPFVPMQTGIADIENFKTIVSVGMNLDTDQPIVYLRVYKAVRKRNALWVKADGLNNSVTDALLKAGADGVLLVPHNLPRAEYVRAEAICRQSGAKLNVLLPDCNSWGAPRAGASPEMLPGMRSFGEARAHVEKAWGASLPMSAGRTTAEIFAGLTDGSVKLLYVMGSDPATRYHDPAVAKAALGAAKFVIAQELFLTETCQYADVVLPAASFAEKDGTFVNIEGREQKIRAAMSPRGDARPDWRIVADVMSRLGQPVPYFSARDVYREYSRALAPAPAAELAAV